MDISRANSNPNHGSDYRMVNKLEIAKEKSGAYNLAPDFSFHKVFELLYCLFFLIT